MIRRISSLNGDKLGASDGDVGEVKDFYFDDQKWCLRYIVADTGDWLRGRLVLLSPHAFGSFYEDGHSLLVNLTRKQIEDSPAIESHKPVSRQYEEEYYRYYGWPSYWEGSEIWGAGGFPGVPPPPFLPRMEEGSLGKSTPDEDPHLRSMKAVNGYHIQTKDGTIGHVTDFMVDDKSWAIRYLVVETGHWFAGKEIVLSPNQVDRISYEESKIFVNVTMESLRDAIEFHAPPVVYHDSHNCQD